MKKKLIIGICIFLIAVLLIPIPMRLKDGGTVRYNAILYTIEDVHRINPDINSDQAYLEGTIIKILGIEVFNNINDNESKPANVTFQAEILEVHDGYFLVKPETSWAINTADKIEVPTENMDASLEPEVGDIIEVSYNGEILETYPARLNKVTSIKVIQEAEKWDLKPMVMIDGVIYLTTGKSNGEQLTSDVIDGKITSEVDGSEKPTQNDQSNFGTGFYYRYGKESTVELLHEGEWWIYEAETTE